MVLLHFPVFPSAACFVVSRWCVMSWRSKAVVGWEILFLLFGGGGQARRQARQKKNTAVNRVQYLWRRVKPVDAELFYRGVEIDSLFW